MGTLCYGPPYTDVDSALVLLFNMSGVALPSFRLPKFTCCGKCLDRSLGVTSVFDQARRDLEG